MEFFEIEISYDCGVMKEYRTRTTMSEESFSSIKPHSVAGGEYSCLSKKTKLFSVRNLKLSVE